MTIKFVTACRCDRLVAWPDPLPPEIRVPLYRPPTFMTGSDSLDSIPVTVRRFVNRGLDGGVPVYREFDEGVSERPKMRPLSNDEWAAAVAHFSRKNVLGQHGEEDRERAASWANADLDFMRRHDGGVMVQHKSGALVGAFYPAPSWDASEDCIRLWTALRAALAEYPT